MIKGRALYLKVAGGMVTASLLLAVPPLFAEAQPQAKTWFGFGKGQSSEAGSPKENESAAVSAKGGSNSNSAQLAKMSPAEKNLIRVQQIQQAEQAKKIQDTNRAVSNVMRVSSAANAASLSQSADVLRISEQARTQNRIMANLEASKNTVPPVKKTSVDEILKQEKIRQHRQTAEQSRRAIEAIEKNSNLR